MYGDVSGSWNTLLHSIKLLTFDFEKNKNNKYNGNR